MKWANGVASAKAFRRDFSCPCATPSLVKTPFHSTSRRRASSFESSRTARREEPRFRTFIARPDRSLDRKSTRLNSSHVSISYAVFCLKKKKKKKIKLLKLYIYMKKRYHKYIY